MFGAILSLVLLFYFLLSGPAIVRGLLALVPPGQRPLARHIASQADPAPNRDGMEAQLCERLGGQGRTAGVFPRPHFADRRSHLTFSAGLPDFGKESPCPSSPA